MQLDVWTALLALAGIAVVSGFAIVAGAVSARIFFDATNEKDDP